METDKDNAIQRYLIARKLRAEAQERERACKEALDKATLESNRLCNVESGYEQLLQWEFYLTHQDLILLQQHGRIKLED